MFIAAAQSPLQRREGGYVGQIIGQLSSTLTWSSSNATVATVSADDLVTPKALGAAQDGDTVTLLRSQTAPIQTSQYHPDYGEIAELVLTKDITLDLGGHSLIAECVYIPADKKVTSIENGSIYFYGKSLSPLNFLSVKGELDSLESVSPSLTAASEWKATVRLDRFSRAI